MALTVFQMLDLTGRALSVQRERLGVVSSNLANAQTTRTAEGGPYKRRDVVLAEDSMKDSFGHALDASLAGDERSVKVKEIRQDTAEPRRVYEPGHPDADTDGYVAYPNINTVEEMVNMITVMRSYQANLTVVTAVREMAQRALGIGRNG